jgi:predicted amino acid-binding ACT domain protein
LTELLITAVGRDKPGLVSEVSEAVFDAGGNIEDMDQVVMRNIFVMSMLVSFKNPRKPVKKLEALLKGKERKTGLKISVYRVGSLLRGGKPAK